MRVVRAQFQALFQRKACAVQRGEDEASGRFVFGRERCKLVRRHPDMHRPSQVVGDDDGSAVPRMVSIAPHRLGQELCRNSSFGIR